MDGSIEKSGPQSPETTGGAERAVRGLKESLACLGRDVFDEGYILKWNRDSATCIARYISQVYNNYHCPSGSQSTPLELVVGQKRNPPASCLIGSVCFAEIPDSLVVYAGPRFLPSAFVGPELGSRGVLVLSLAGEDPWR